MSLVAADLKGVLPALVTPFDKAGKFDPAAMSALIDRVFAAGAAGIVPLGGTGEYTALSHDERLAVIETSVAAAKGRGPVIAGVLSPGFEEAAAAGKAFGAAGVDALMVVTPFYVIAGQQGLLDYYRRMRDEVGLPIVLYEIPTRTNVSYAPETVAALAEEGVAIGIKYSNYDMVKFTRVMRAAGDRMAVMSGEDSLLVAHMVLGAPGAILATANVYPEHWVECFNRASSGDFAGAAVLQKDLYPMIEAFFCEPNPGPLKKAMAIAGHDVGPVRLPLVDVTPETDARLRSVMRDVPDVSTSGRMARSA
ncbi:4-hydroxy-tetrahydrodipicolinate synthase [Microbaculum marinum]|uniref:4-hydroxy-tetrahydrodipicolinate synthase n=1 Tax=Microbaculum marinum TaxID=1764581 RepID=A0AAW9S2H2_9HYPH